MSEPAVLSPGAAAFIETAVACGIPLHRDINADSIEGVAPIQMNVRAGFRRSTARAYLKPARGRPNLRVLTGIDVTKLLIEDGRAVGCTARRSDGSTTEFRAAREVVLSAGSIMSPKLLMLSGIGDGAALQELGIPVVQAIYRALVRTCRIT